MIITPESPQRFKSAIQGVDCTILVTHYLPAEPAITSGPMEAAQEEIPAEFTFIVLCENTDDEDVALMDTLDDQDHFRIFDEFEAYLLALKHDKDF